MSIQRVYLMNLILTKIGLIFIISLGKSLSVSAQTAHMEMRGLSSLEMAAEMAPGVNLWNTLDAVCWWCDDCKNGMDSETIWGRPVTTPEMIQAIADKGFKSIRIPVTWFNHMGPAPDYTIDQEWMDRVEEVANYAFDANLYVIINIHHDDYSEEHPGSWLSPTYAKQDAVTDQLEKVWTQIATRFKDYGDYLVFETMNEPREVGGPKEWEGGTTEHRNVINAYNVAAVNAIRATGDNNSTRFIMVPQVGANVEAAVESLVIPNEDPNIIVAVHAYYPFSFCIGDENVTQWGTASDVTHLENSFAPLNTKFVKNGIGVVMGEWGASDKDNYDQRINYYKIYTGICKKYKITPIPWIYDFNRSTLTWENPQIVDAILDYYKADVSVGDVHTNPNELKACPNLVTDFLNITYRLHCQSDVEINILDINGRAIENLEKNNHKPPGNYSISWQRKNLSRGLYFLVMIQNNKNYSRKILLK